jgi:hypothetical protein
MPQAKKATGGQRKGRTGAGTRTTKSTARSAKSSSGSGTRSAKSSSGSGTRSAKSSAGSGTRTRRATTQAKAAEPGAEAAAERIREVNERIIDAGKRAGLGTLDIYESTLKAVADSLERGPGSSDIDWISNIATAQANFIRDVTKAWASAARQAIK